MSPRLALQEVMIRAERPARRIVEIALVLIAAIILVRLVWLIAAPQASVAHLQDRPLPSPISDARQSIAVDRSVLVRANPFAAGLVAASDVPDAPETQLNLRLTGVLMSTDAFGGSAQIITPDNQAGRYTKGSEILPGVTLERILSDRVILRRDGQSEALTLGGRGAGLSVIGDGRPTDTGQAKTDDTPAPVTDGRVASPAALMQAVQLAAVDRQGSLHGYALSLRGSADIMAIAGLVPGDILLEINHRPVRDMDAVGLASEFGVQQVAVLLIERAGTLRTVRLVFDE